jgi:hypothetical protein
MRAWVSVSLVLLAACSQRDVSTLKYTKYGNCENCAIAPAKNEPYQVPDSEQPFVPDHEAPYQAPAPIAEPTCKLVAQSLVALELGNHAEPEVVAPKVAAEEKRCVTMKLSRDDRSCVIDATDQQTVAYCVPALFPKEPPQPTVDAATCEATGRAMRNVVDATFKQQPKLERGPLERQLAAAIEACRADRWNEQMVQCARYSVPVSAQNCQYVYPYAMWKKLERRLEKARGG